MGSDRTSFIRRRFFYDIAGLYTDGKQLYVTCGDFEGSRNKYNEAFFARIQTDTVEKHMLNFDVMILEPLVE